MLEHLTKILYKEGVGIGLRCDENGEPIYEEMVWESDTHPRPTKEEFDAAVAKAREMLYINNRRVAYPTVQEQLDTLFHHGYEGWKESVQAVKDQYPKPS